MKNPEERISAREALYHEWLARKEFNMVSPGYSKVLINNLKSFQVFYRYSKV